MSSAPLGRDAAACWRRTRRRASVALSAGILAIACHAEQLTGPSAMLPVPRADAGGILGPASIPIPENNTAGGALPAMSAGLSVPVATSFIVRVSGQTTVSNNPAVQQCDPTQPVFGGASVGPNGDAYYQLKVSASLRQPSGNEFAIGFWERDGGSALESDTLWASTALEVRVARSGIQGSMNGQNCSSGLYNLSSAQTISVEVLDGHELQLEPSAVVVRTGTPVSFTATSRGAAVTVPSWAFVPASATPPNETSTCGADGANPCVVTVKNTGELRVSRYLYGRWRSASAALRVYTTFTLAADRSAVPPGGTVTFTPTLDGVDGLASRWAWRPDSGGAVMDPCASITGGKCAYAPAASGTMWAYTNSNDSASAPVTVRPATLALAASKTSVLAPGENVTFTPVGNGTVVVQGWSFTPDGGGTLSRGGPTVGILTPSGAARSRSTGAQFGTPTAGRFFVSVGSAWGSCLAEMPICENQVVESGIVEVLAMVDGVQLTSGVHVTFVYPEMAPDEDDITSPDDATLIDPDVGGPVDCSPAAKAAQEAKRLYCEGSTPDSLQRARISDALARMNARGGACSGLAQIGDALFNGTPIRIRLFPQALSATLSGGAPVGGALRANGGKTGPNAWMVMAKEWVDVYYDSAHATKAPFPTAAPYPRTLQHLLVHELDHLNGVKDHALMGKGRTPNSAACDDLPD
ncbi:MAG TPA: hypothetical protein VM033_05220 [Gemmatimonadaceae bacterium]|nr:hypothetical protein [Gemmatimonadaceae bacterium]